MLLNFKAKKFSETMLLMLAKTHDGLTLKKLEVELDRLVNSKKLLPVITDKVTYVVEDAFKVSVDQTHQLFSNLLDHQMINVAFSPKCASCSFSMSKQSVSNSTFSFKCENEMCGQLTTFIISQTHEKPSDE